MAYFVLPGDGPTTGKSLCLHNDVDCVAFTGSGEVENLFYNILDSQT